MTHDPLCPHTEFIPCCESYLEHEYPQPAKQHYVACQCDLIAKARADEDATGVVWESDNGYLCLGPRVIRWPEGKHPEGLQALALLISLLDE